MRKSELESYASRLNESKAIMSIALKDIRQVARDCITQKAGKTVSSAWLLEKITAALIKAGVE